MFAPGAGLSLSQRCVLLGVARSSLYYRPRFGGAEGVDLLKRLDRIFADYTVRQAAR